MARYTAEDVARFIVNMCIDEKCPISNLQLQKILYFCQREYHRATGNPLFDDDFQAWQYGPVIPDIYKMFSLFGGMKITRRVAGGVRIAPEDVAIISAVVKDKREKYPWDLVEITHTPGSPWDKTYRNGDGNGDVISKSLIFSYGDS